MAEYTDQVETECERRAVFAIDVLDVNRRLLVEHVPVTETLEDCGCGKRKCAYLEEWINKHRTAAGKEPIADGSITPATTIKDVITHVC